MGARPAGMRGKDAPPSVRAPDMPVGAPGRDARFRFLDELLDTPAALERFHELLHRTHEQPEEHLRNAYGALHPSAWKCMNEADRERTLEGVRLRLAVAICQLEGA